MKQYSKPEIIAEEAIIVEDVIAKSFGESLPGDREIGDFWGEE